MREKKKWQNKEIKLIPGKQKKEMEDVMLNVFHDCLEEEEEVGVVCAMKWNGASTLSTPVQTP